MGSLPKNVASTEVATPRSMCAISSQTQYTSKVFPPMPPYSSGTKRSVMPTLSGLHRSWTTSRGHSSFSSSSIRVGSGRRFLANSRSDFKLSFRVLAVIMFDSSLCGNRVHFADFRGHIRQKHQNVVDDADVGDLKNRSFWVFVNGDDEGIAFESGQVLKGPADAAGQVDLRLHRLPGRT